MCIAQGCSLNEQQRRRLTPEHRFKSPSEMVELFTDLPEAINNTLVVANRCSFLQESRSTILPKSPKYSDHMSDDAFRKFPRAGLEKRLHSRIFDKTLNSKERKHLAKPYLERLEYECDIILRMGFASYFLIVADFIHWARK